MARCRSQWFDMTFDRARQRSRPQDYNFTPDHVWDGLNADSKTLCNGLIRDWVSWQFQKKDVFGVLCDTLRELSPHPDETIQPGQPMRVSVEDVRDIPTVELPYGTVPVTHASAGMRRIMALAYLMVWTWTEHRAAAELLNEEPADRLVLLVDEVEAHLHPQWQRVLLPALLRAIEKLRSDLAVQIIASTHAPLVLASVEPHFDEARDRVFTFELTNGSVEVKTVPWAKQGDAVGWLTSEVFGLRQARSADAERAIEAAEAFMRDDLAALPSGLQTKEAIHQELTRVLPGHDPFWPRWVVRTEGDAT